MVGERADLLATLASHRYFLRFTVRDLTDEEAAQRPTVSALTLGGLLKHVADVESAWVDFILGGAEAMAHGVKDGEAASGAEDWSARFRVEAGTSLATLLERYEQVAVRTDSVVATLPDLDNSHALPDEPWFEKGARWSARRVLLHVIAETAQHAGHADIIRESIDGAKTMG
jgi:uncharacterized damage-inducible protein DinB